MHSGTCRALTDLDISVHDGFLDKDLGSSILSMIRKKGIKVREKNQKLRQERNVWIFHAYGAFT